MSPPRRGTKRARSKSPEPKADGSLSALGPIDEPGPGHTTLVHSSNSEDSRWGLNPLSGRGKSCEQGCCSEITVRWKSASLTERAIPPAVLSMMKTIEHIQSYPWLQDAIRNEPDIVSKPYMLLRVPQIMVAMAFDWDLTCAHPFLKRLCHQLKSEVMCGQGSRRGDDVDLVLSLPSSPETKGSTLEPIPICPVFVRSGTHQDTTDRLKKWLGDYLVRLEPNRFAHPGHEWPVPYFVLEGSWWTVGVAIQGASGLRLYEEKLCSIDWYEGVSRVTLVLGHIIGSTADHYREWYRENGPNRLMLEEG